MSKKKQPIVDKELQQFLEHNFKELCEKRIADNKTWSELIAHIIVQFDRELHEAEMIIKQAEAILDEATEEKQDES